MAQCLGFSPTHNKSADVERSRLQDRTGLLEASIGPFVPDRITVGVRDAWSPVSPPAEQRPVRSWVQFRRRHVVIPFENYLKGGRGSVTPFADSDGRSGASSGSEGIAARHARSRAALRSLLREAAIKAQQEQQLQADAADPSLVAQEGLSAEAKSASTGPQVAEAGGRSSGSPRSMTAEECAAEAAELGALWKQIMEEDARNGGSGAGAVRRSGQTQGGEGGVGRGPMDKTIDRAGTTASRESSTPVSVRSRSRKGHEGGGDFKPHGTTGWVKRAHDGDIEEWLPAYGDVRVLDYINNNLTDAEAQRFLRRAAARAAAESKEWRVARGEAEEDTRPIANDVRGMAKVCVDWSLDFPVDVQGHFTRVESAINSHAVAGLHTRICKECWDHCKLCCDRELEHAAGNGSGPIGGVYDTEGALYCFNRKCWAFPILCWMAFGVPLPVNQAPPPPLETDMNYKQLLRQYPKSTQAAWRKIVDSGAVRRAELGEVEVNGAVFAVVREKDVVGAHGVDGEFRARIVYDMSVWQNKGTVPLAPFRYWQLTRNTGWLEEHSIMASEDYASWYTQIPLAEHVKARLGVAWYQDDHDAQYNGQFLYNTVPFGSALGCFVGNMVSSFVGDISETIARATLGDDTVWIAEFNARRHPGWEWRHRLGDAPGCGIRFYIDDALCKAKYWCATVVTRQILRVVSAMMGFVFKPNDSMPDCRMVFCGMAINTCAGTLNMTEEARCRLQVKAKQVHQRITKGRSGRDGKSRSNSNGKSRSMRKGQAKRGGKGTGRGVRVPLIQQLAGSFGHYAQFIHGANSHTLPLQQLAGVANYKGLRFVTVGRRIETDIEFWMEELGKRGATKTLRLSVNVKDAVLLATDGSGLDQNGGAAVVIDTRRHLVFIKRYRWTERDIRQLRRNGTDSSTLRELEIAFKAAESLERELQVGSDRQVIYLGDSRSAVADLGRGDASREGRLRTATRRTAAALAGKDAPPLIPLHVRREHPLIVFADAAGRFDVDT